DRPEQVELTIELEHRLIAEVNAPKESTPLLDLLCDALGPNARWAALAEGRAPFDGVPTDPAARWWYAPWFSERPGEAPASTTALRQVAACAAWLSRRHALSDEAFDGEIGRIRVDPWTGVVQVPHWKEEEHENICTHSLSGRDLLLLPWPWPSQVGVLSSTLRWGMRNTLHWQPGRTLDWVASPCLCILPIGDPKEPALNLPGEGRPEGPAERLRREIPLASGWSPLLPPVDWLALALPNRERKPR
ncbi:MAG: hypothetical protein KKB70_04715, partial [Proteobacteria bacterium]|nr:hypothetical protein [Pseudomonadota bacterium]